MAEGYRETECPGCGTRYVTGYTRGWVKCPFCRHRYMLVCRDGSRDDKKKEETPQ